MIMEKQVQIHEEPNKCFIDPEAPKSRKRKQPNHIYHAEQDHLTSSSLKTLLRSPAHWMYGRDNPKAETAAMRFGTAFHTAFLEPEEFKKEYIVMPVFNNRTNAGKAERAEWEEKNAGKTFISEPEYESIDQMRKSLLQNPAVMNLMGSGHAEHSFYSHLHTQLMGDEPDEWSPIKVKCRPDFLRKDFTVVSLKTTKNASPDEFARTCAKFKYALSEAFYLDILSQFAKRQLYKVYMVVVESEAPYGVSVYKCSQEFLTEGRHQYRKALKKYLYCNRSEIWHGYEIDSTEKDGTLDLNLPGFGYDQVLFDKSFKQF